MTVSAPTAPLRVFMKHNSPDTLDGYAREWTVNDEIPSRIVDVMDIPADAPLRKLFRSCRPFDPEFYRINGYMELIEGEYGRITWETMPFERIRVRAFSDDPANAVQDTPEQRRVLQQNFRGEELRRAREAYSNGWILELLNPWTSRDRQGDECVLVRLYGMLNTCDSDAPRPHVP